MLADAELEPRGEASYAGAFWSAGQKCTATRRILVQDGLRRVRERVPPGSPREGRRSGRPRGRGRAGRQRGGADRHPRRDRAGEGSGWHRSRRRRAGDEDGYLVPPTVFEGHADDAELSCEEVFGPVTVVYRFSTRRGNRARERRALRPLDRDLHARPARRAAVHRGASALGSSTSTPRPPAPTSTSRSAASRAPAGGRTSRDGRDRVLHGDGHGLPGRAAWLSRPW